MIGGFVLARTAGHVYALDLATDNDGYDDDDNDYLTIVYPWFQTHRRPEKGADSTFVMAPGLLGGGAFVLTTSGDEAS